MEKESTEKVCEFEYDNRKCQETEIVGIARCKDLCMTHFRTVVKDNVRRFNKGEDIPEELIFTKPLRSSDTFSKFNGRLTIKEKEELENGN